MIGKFVLDGSEIRERVAGDRNLLPWLQRDVLLLLPEVRRRHAHHHDRQTKMGEVSPITTPPRGDQRQRSRPTSARAAPPSGGPYVFVDDRRGDSHAERDTDERRQRAYAGSEKDGSHDGRTCRGPSKRAP